MPILVDEVLPSHGRRLCGNVDVPLHSVHGSLRVRYDLEGHTRSEWKVENEIYDVVRGLLGYLYSHPTSPQPDRAVFGEEVETLSSYI